MIKNKKIQVAVRIRPVFNQFQDEQSWQIDSSGKTIVSINNKINLRNQSVQSTNNYEYSADYIFNQIISNKEIYQTCCSKLVNNFIENKDNGTIFMYGQTTSGKTYTMLGNHKQKGIIIFSLMEIFQKMKAMSKNCTITISYLQIYNQQVNDLLNSQLVNLKIIQNNIQNLTQEVVSNFKQAIELLMRGQEQRSYKEKKYHQHSSRSHTIFQIKLKKSDKVESMINLVDLAGSQRLQEDTCNEETSFINKSLFVLSNVIQKLAANKKNNYIPFRDSKLTRLLSSSLLGNSQTMIICTISPALINFNQTLSTLRFAAKSKKIEFRNITDKSLDQSSIHQTRKSSNLSVTDMKLLEQLKQQNSILKKNLSMVKELSYYNKENQQNYMDIQIKKLYKAIQMTNSSKYERRQNLEWQGKIQTLADQYSRNINILKRQYMKAIINATSKELNMDKQYIQQKMQQQQNTNDSDQLKSDLSFL